MTVAELQHILVELGHMNLDSMREEWRRRYGAPSALRSAGFLRLMLAWRLQAEIHGGLDDDTRRKLKRSGTVQPEGRQLGVGATLTRNWKGRKVTVVVEENGFRWDGQIFPSLSAAATAIAGTRWNGPRFFGLRDN